MVQDLSDAKGSERRIADIEECLDLVRGWFSFEIGQDGIGVENRHRDLARLLSWSRAC